MRSETSMRNRATNRATSGAPNLNPPIRRWVGAAVAMAIVVAAGLWTGKVGLTALVFLAVAAPLCMGLIRRPQRGALVLVALVPFDGLLLLVHHLPSSARTWKEVLALATLAATFVAPADVRAPAGRRHPAWVPAVAGLLLIGVGSAALVSKTQAITGFRIDFFYLLLAAAIWRCPLDKHDQDRLVTILMATGLITALVGIAQQVLGPSRLASLGYQYNTTIRTTGGHLRSFSTFVNPFGFSFFLMIVLLIALPSALTDLRRLRNQAFLACTPILGVALLLTFTRGAWIGLGVGILYLGFRRHRILLLAVPLAALAFAYLPGSIASTSASSSSLGQRTAGWSANFHSVVEHPLGVGIGATGAAAAKVAALQTSGSAVDSSVPGTPTYQPDNYYFKTVYELGVPGLWLLLLLLAAAFASTASVARSKRGTESAVALGTAASVLAAATASLVASYLEIFPMDLLFWLLLATVAAPPLTTSSASDG